MNGKQRTALLSVGAALLLVTLKLATGLISGSLGLVSAAVESSGDLAAALLTLWAVRLADSPADDDHPFGHARVENLSALAEGVILLGGGLFVVFEALRRLTGSSSSDLKPTLPVFLVLAVIVVVDLSRTIVSFRSAGLHGSAALRANAFHFAADLAGSAAVIAGLSLAALGHPHADAVAALFIALLIFAASGRLLFENVQSLMDKSPVGAEQAVREAISTLASPLEVRRVRVREAAGRPFVDIVVALSATAALAESHEVSDQVEAAVLNALPGADVIVHVEPTAKGSLPIERVLAAALSVPGVREAHNILLFEVGGSREVSIHLKVPGDLTLADGHSIGLQVEEAIIVQVPGVSNVQTHLEPLDGHTVGRTPTASEQEPLATTVREVAAEHDAEVQEVRFFDGERGMVGFVTLSFPGQLTVKEAHERASQIERRVHRKERRIRELVIHTEPTENEPS